MQNQRVPRLDNKANRRKMNATIQNITKKTVELSTQYNCEILLIIYTEQDKHWLQYCSSDASHLFFGYQSAKEHLEKVENYDNYNYNKFLKTALSPENSHSPRPIKHIKIDEKDSFLSQPIKVVGKTSDSFLSSMSTDGTKSNLPKHPDGFPPKINETFKLNTGNSSLPFKTIVYEADSSPDFDFETYFASDNNT